MAKRFTDSDKWKKQWFRKLPPVLKCLWVYICDNCDICGLWDVDFELASVFIGEIIDEEVVKAKFEKQYKAINGNKWFIKDFVSFQYGELIDNNNLHRSVIKKLKDLGVFEGLNSPSAGDKVKDKDKVKESITPSQEIYSYYCKSIKAGAQEDAIKHINRLLTKEGFTREDLLGRIDAYKQDLVKNKKEDKIFYIQANNFFGQKARFKEFEPIKKIEYLPANQHCSACKGQGKLLNGEGQVVRCGCVKERELK